MYHLFKYKKQNSYLKLSLMSENTFILNKTYTVFISFKGRIWDNLLLWSKSKIT